MPTKKLEDSSPEPGNIEKGKVEVQTKEKTMCKLYPYSKYIHLYPESSPRININPTIQK